MGDLMRRYWIPVLLSEQLAEPDCPPLRVTIFGEHLVAFRDTEGRPGLIAQHCPHRGASLFFGRNEESGLRCVYHGWKFDVSGRCIDMPNEPTESNFKEKIRAVTYPCRDRGGVIWAYLGPAELQPGLPELEWAVVPATQRFMTRRLQECNWLQALEGGFDPSHLAFLHRGLVAVNPDGYQKNEVVRTGWGLSVGNQRDFAGGQTSWRVNQLMMPFYKMITPRGQDATIGFHGWVPVDDESCMVYSIDWHPERALTQSEIDHNLSWDDIHAERIPGSDRTALNRDNEYRIDRALQRSGSSFTGIKGLAMQDSGIQESQGRIHDRSREHLGSSDASIVQIRSFLVDALRGFQRGVEPPGVDPSTHRVRAAALTLPNGTPLDAVPRALVQAGSSAYSSIAEASVRRMSDGSAVEEF